MLCEVLLCKSRNTMHVSIYYDDAIYFSCWPQEQEIGCIVHQYKLDNVVMSV